MVTRREAIIGAGALAGAAFASRVIARMGRGAVASSSSSLNPMATNFAAGGQSALSGEAFPLFKNRVREGRGFTASSAGTSQVTLSSAGWPTQDFTCLLWEGVAIPGWASNATLSTPMKCGFVGSGSETISSFGCTVGNVVHGTGGAYTTFDLYNVTASPFGFNVGATTGGATNVFAYLPAYPGSTIDDVTQTSAYTPEAIAKYKAMAGIRWMWMSNVAENTGLNTSGTRRTPSNTQSNQSWDVGTGGQNYVCEGYPPELLMYFLKACGPQTAAYFCLPVWEDGTNNAAGSYSNSLLTAINTILIPNGNTVYLEIGNEFFDYPIGGNTGQTLNTLAYNNGFSANTNAYNAGVWQYLGYKLHALANMCRTIFGSKFGTQVKIVLASQPTGNGWGNFLPTTLQYMETNYGNPGSDIQCISIANYVNLTNNAGDTSIAAVLSDLGTQGQKQPYQNQAEHVSVLGSRYGMTLIAYEAGFQVNSEAAGNAYIGPAIMDAGMQTTMRDQVWKPMMDAGYTLIFNFESGVSSGGTSGYSPEDEWSNDYASFVSSGSPRYAAMIDLSTGSYQPQRNVLTSRGQTFSGGNSVDNVGGAAVGCTDAYGSLLSNAWAMQIYVPTNMVGSYAPTINITGSATNATVEVNGSTVQTGALSAGNNALPSTSLKAGFNSIIIYNGGGITAVNQVQLN